MSWVQVTLWRWRCDGCRWAVELHDDAQPDGWVHTMDGRDLCGCCVRMLAQL